MEHLKLYFPMGHLKECDNIFGVCSSITNYLLQGYPLRNDEHSIYRGVISWFKSEQEEIARQKSVKRKRERKNRKNRNMVK